MSTKIQISKLKLNDAFFFDSETDKEIYVAVVVDASKQIFKATKISNKSQITLKPTDKIIVVDDVPDFPSPKLGQELLKI